jgi:hypothetical protein
MASNPGPLSYAHKFNRARILHFPSPFLPAHQGEGPGYSLELGVVSLRSIRELVVVSIKEHKILLSTLPLSRKEYKQGN